MNTYKILVVEDDPNINELIKITLSSPDYSLSAVDNGYSALDKLLTDKPDLAILDIMIPGPDGWKVYTAIRSNPDLAHTRVIILSALLFRPEFLMSKQILATDMFMKKPFELDDLRTNVKKLLGYG